MSFRTADGAPISIPVDEFRFFDGINLVGEIADICFAADPELFCVFFGVYFMVQAGITSLIVVHEIILIHIDSFLLDRASFHICANELLVNGGSPGVLPANRLFILPIDITSFLLL